MSYIGPEIGTLIGMAYADHLNQADFHREREIMREKLKAATEQALGSEAIKDAAKAVLNATVDELQAEQAGKLAERRFSDPANVRGRNEAFMDTADGQLQRLSGGALRFTEASKRRVKESPLEVSEQLARGRGPTIR